MIGNLIPGLISLGVAPSTNSYESIATVTVGSGGAANVEFTSIPADYTHLQIRGIARSTYAETFNAASIKFNDDSGSTYSAHALYGNGASVSTEAGASISPGYPMYAIGSSGSTATASVFGVSVVDILDYKDTNKYKTVRSLMGMDNNGNGRVYLSSANWRSTSAITKITITLFNNNFSEYSQFALYGIKGA